VNGMGNIVPVPTEQLSYPTNRTTVHLESNDIPVVSIESIDWVSFASETVVCSTVIDVTPPDLVVYDGSGWTASLAPVIKVLIDDGTEGSGVNLSSITMRTGIDTEELGEWSKRIKVVEEVVGPGNYPSSCRVSAGLTVPDGWKGWVQFKASDMTGNTGISQYYSLKVDRTPPTLKVVHPPNNTKVNGKTIRIKLLVLDEQGSGVNNKSIMVREKTQRCDWNDWSSIDEVSGELFTFNIDLPLGSVEVQFQVADMVGNQVVSAIWYLEVLNPPINLPPVPVIKAPLNGSVVYLGDTLVLDAQGTSDDGLGLYHETRLTWTSNINGFLGNGNLLIVRLDKGLHRITLYADDGTPRHNISTTVAVEVKERDLTDDDDEDRPNGNGANKMTLLILIVISIIILIVIGIILHLLALKRKSVNPSDKKNEKSQPGQKVNFPTPVQNPHSPYVPETASRIGTEMTALGDPSMTPPAPDASLNLNRPDTTPQPIIPSS